MPPLAPGLKQRPGGIPPSAAHHRTARDSPTAHHGCPPDPRIGRAPCSQIPPDPRLRRTPSRTQSPTQPASRPGPEPRERDPRPSGGVPGIGLQGRCGSGSPSSSRRAAARRPARSVVQDLRRRSASSGVLSSSSATVIRACQTCFALTALMRLSRVGSLGFLCCSTECLQVALCSRAYNRLPPPLLLD